MISALGLTIGLRESAAERMVKLYRDDARVELRLGPSASKSSLGLSISGSF